MREIRLYVMCMIASSWCVTVNSAVEEVALTCRRAFSLIDNAQSMHNWVENAFKRSGMSADEFSFLLASIAEDSLGPQGTPAPGVGNHAMSFLRIYGTTNALLFLERIVMNPGGDDWRKPGRQARAMNAFAKIDGSGRRSVDLATRAFASTNSFEVWGSAFYEALNKYATPKNSALVDAFLLSRLPQEQKFVRTLDDILCRRIKDFETSSARMDLARRAMTGPNAYTRPHFSNVVVRLRDVEVNHKLTEVNIPTNAVFRIQ